MDILYLVDRIEAIINAGQKVPFSSRVVVDEHETMDVLDQMRVVIPEEIKSARRVNQDRERITQQADAEAARILHDAVERAAQMVRQDQAVIEADRQAEAILRRADQQAEEIRAGADQYALEVLRALESHMLKTVETVRRGITTLEQTIREGEPR